MTFVLSVLYFSIVFENSIVYHNFFCFNQDLTPHLTFICIYCIVNTDTLFLMLIIKIIMLITKYKSYIAYLSSSVSHHILDLYTTYDISACYNFIDRIVTNTITLMILLKQITLLSCHIFVYIYLM